MWFHFYSIRSIINLHFPWLQCPHTLFGKGKVIYCFFICFDIYIYIYVSRVSKWHPTGSFFQKNPIFARTALKKSFTPTPAGRRFDLGRIRPQLYFYKTFLKKYIISGQIRVHFDGGWQITRHANCLDIAWFDHLNMSPMHAWTQAMP